ncbi:MAG: DUF1573 domain-containing protein [Arenimonas sp.]|nr:DUF1573 domain-containing protein [Arenimonas sp.]
MRSRLLVILLLASALTWLGVASAQGEKPADCAECQFNFGTVVQGDVVQHQFPLRNDGNQPLRIAGVQLSPPLQLAKMPAMIPAKGSAVLNLSMDSSNLEGPFEGKLVVMLSDPLAEPRVFSLAGKISPPIEILPLPAFFVSTSKGVAKSATLEIINHQRDPIDLKIQTPPTANYQLKLQPIKPGKRFRLTITVPATAPAGRTSSRLELKSSSAAKPIVYVGVNTNVRERVYTFPESLDFGRLTMRELKSAQAAQVGAVQTLMVYQTGGKNFGLKARSSVRGIGLAAERGPQGDRVQITASMIAGKAVPGPIRGTIELQTNDPEFPKLTVPVTGEIVAE